jgi:hypothetical protein
MSTTWNVDVYLLYKGEPWTGKQVELWIDWPTSIPFITGGWTHLSEYADDDGHAEFAVEDMHDALRSHTSVEIRVSLNGTKHDFGPYEIGDGAFTVNVDP